MRLSAPLKFIESLIDKVLVKLLKSAPNGQLPVIDHGILLMWVRAPRLVCKTCLVFQTVTDRYFGAQRVSS